MGSEEPRKLSFLQRTALRFVKKKPPPSEGGETVEPEAEGDGKNAEKKEEEEEEEELGPMAEVVDDGVRRKPLPPTKFKPAFRKELDHLTTYHDNTFLREVKVRAGASASASAYARACDGPP